MLIKVRRWCIFPGNDATSGLSRQVCTEKPEFSGEQWALLAAEPVQLFYSFTTGKHIFGHSIMGKISIIFILVHITHLNTHTCTHTCMHTHTSTYTCTPQLHMHTHVKAVLEMNTHDSPPWGTHRQRQTHTHPMTDSQVSVWTGTGQKTGGK